MIKIVKASSRHHSDFGWLDTHWHFSFDTYYDPKNVHWGPLRVFNDDVIQPGRGFGTHPHRDMEIVTYVLAGKLEHQDNQGNRGVVQAGEVQVMSAGTGIMHSEYNHSQEKPVHLLQLWIFPRTRGLKPHWEQRVFPRVARAGRLLPVVTGSGLPGTLAIDQDAQIYVSTLESGQAVIHKTSPDRRAYLFAIEGNLTINGALLAKGDQARISGEALLKIHAEENCDLILLDLPEIREEPY